MKYNVIGSNDYIFDLRASIFENRGIDRKDIEKFLNPTRIVENSYKKLDNIITAVKVLKKHLENKSRIHIIADSDCDGYCSGSAMYLALKEIYPLYNSHLTWNIHEEKAHGIVIEELEEFKNSKGKYNFDLLIVPDAGSSDVKECKILKELGIDVIILDHHESDVENDYAIVVNPQLSPNYPNKEICGTTVVYKFLQALDKELKCSVANNYIDLVAVATISDMMDTRELENRYYINQGLKKIKNPFVQALIKKQSFSMKRTNIKGIGWYIAPLINAVTRVGTVAERKDLFRAFTDTELQIIYKRSKNAEEQLVYLYEDMARQLVNIKSRQDRLRDKVSPTLLLSANENNVLNIIKMDDDVKYKHMKGVLAMKVASNINRPTLLFVERKVEVNGEIKTILQGSGRNLDYYFIDNLRDELISSGLFINAAGHGNAFGFSLLLENKDKAIEFFNKKYENHENSVTVDFEINSSKLQKSLVKTFDNLKDIWGQSFKEPKVIIKDVVVKNAVINEKKSLLSFVNEDTGIEYKLFFPNEKVILDLTNEEKDVTIDVIGGLDINEWNGDKTYQVVIEDYEITDSRKVKKFKNGKGKGKDDFFF